MLWLLYLSVLLSCQKSEDAVQVRINLSFEMDPPIPSAVWIEKLKEPVSEGNFLITAQFNKKEVQSDAFAFMLSDSITLVMHDDGKNNDEKRGDGIYSLVIKQDEQAVQKEFADFTRRLKEQKQIVRFEKRQGIILNRDALLKEFPLPERIDPGFRIPIGILELPLPTADDLAKIRSHSLFVMDNSVTGDPVRSPSPCNPDLSVTGVGSWSLGKLLTELCNEPVTGINPIDFTLNWFSLWEADARANGDLLQARAISRVIGEWHFHSGPGQPLRMDRLPFILRAIVNRLDLRGNTGYGFSNAGEGRFIFTAVDHDCNSVPFNIILEYGVNKKTCAELSAYAHQWLDLQTETIGSEAYNAKLQAITDQFTLAGTNPDKPNGSSLNQLRSNEIALDRPWELREFVLADSTHTLELHTVAQTPSDVHNAVNTFTSPLPTTADVERMVKYVNDHAASIATNNYVVPDSVDGAPFLGGKSQVASDFTYHWNGSGNPVNVLRYIVNDEARHIFSLNTCSGCHRGEVQTNFTHIEPTVNMLSSFLTGLGPDSNAGDDDTDPAGLFYVNDIAGRPTSGPAQRGFNDLDRRARDLYSLGGGCTFHISLPRIIQTLRFRPVRMVH